MTINAADAVYLGGTPADAVYMGDVKVWPSAPEAGAPWVGWSFESGAEEWTNSGNHPMGWVAEDSAVPGERGLLRGSGQMSSSSTLGVAFRGGPRGSAPVGPTFDVLRGFGLQVGHTYRWRAVWAITGPPAGGAITERFLQIEVIIQGNIPAFKRIRWGKGEALPVGWQEMVGDPFVYDERVETTGMDRGDTQWAPTFNLTGNSNASNTLYLSAIQYQEVT